MWSEVDELKLWVRLARPSIRGMAKVAWVALAVWALVSR